MRARTRVKKRHQLYADGRVAEFVIHEKQKRNIMILWLIEEVSTPNVKSSILLLLDIS